MARILSLLMLSVLALGACYAQATLDPVTEKAIEEACLQLIDDYVIARDRYDPDGYAAVFADDGEMILPSARFKGHDEIAARIREARGKRRSQHLITTRHVTVLDRNTATGIVYAMVFEEPVGDVSADQALATDGPLAIGFYIDEYRLTERGWKIQTREFRPQFVWEKS
ncbi:MAG: nuclear transport factor 2 family protein [Pseudomonadota bacterium]